MFGKINQNLSQYFKKLSPCKINRHTCPIVPIASRLSKDTFERSNTHSWRKLIPHLKEKINPKYFLGGGAEAKVYAIDENYVLRMFGGAKKIKSRFVPVEDIFEGKNYGQAVAKTKEGISINKRVNGVRLYKCNETDSKIYMENLRKYSVLSDETLEEFVADIAFINSKGWRIDSTNPENFLLDEKTGKIGIIDLCQKGRTSLDLYEPYGHDWVLDPLVNSHDIYSLYGKLNVNEREEFFELINKLEKRIIPLCKKYNIPISKWKKEDYCFDSLINILELKDNIDPKTCTDLYKISIYERYPEMIPAYISIHKQK